MSALIQFTVQQLDDLAAAYRAGATTQNLADRYGICRTAVTSRLRKMGVQLRPRQPMLLTPEVVVQVKQRRAAGETWRSIAESVGVSAEYLWKTIPRRP